MGNKTKINQADRARQGRAGQPQVCLETRRGSDIRHLCAAAASGLVGIRFHPATCRLLRLAEADRDAQWDYAINFYFIGS